MGTNENQHPDDPQREDTPAPGAAQPSHQAVGISPLRRTEAERPPFAENDVAHETAALIGHIPVLPPA